MWSCRDNQEVGLEAATLERVRNSSLVKWFCADNVTGLKHTAEAVTLARSPGPLWLRRMAVLATVTSVAAAGTAASGSFRVQVRGWVGERRVAREAAE